MDSLAAQAQAFLFAEGGPVLVKTLAKALQADEVVLFGALETLEKKLEGTGLTLVRTDHEVALAVASDIEGALREHYEKDLAKDIGSAGLEVLAIVLYRGPSTRAAIDYIRGVNTSSTVRSLLSRGLIERVANPRDAREYLYRATTELLAHVGVRAISELPSYVTIAAELAAFDSTSSDESSSQPKAAHENNNADKDSRTG